MKTRKCISISLVALVVGFAGCGGFPSEGTSSEETTVDEPSTRTITGFVPQTSDTSSSLTIKEETDAGCVANGVYATDTSGDVTSTTVDQDCSFSLTLEAGHTYELSLSDGDEFIASLLFCDNEGFIDYLLKLKDGSELFLGMITIGGEDAFAEHDPLDESNLEEDEESDKAEDEEAEEESTDIGDMGDTSLTPSEPRITQISPRVGLSVSLNESINVRTSCRVQEPSVSSASFTIGDSEGNHIPCNVSLSEAQDEVICEHDGLLPGMFYTATVEGLECAEGEEQEGTIRTLTWHFTTE